MSDSMPPAPTTGDVFAERVKTARQAKRWTVRELTARCSAVLPGLTEASVTNIERGRREVSVAEWLRLADVLQVPPVALLLPFGTGASVEIVPGTVTPVERALAWLTAEGPEGLDGGTR